MKDCKKCNNCVAIGEGDHICILGEKPVLVIDSYDPNENFGKCKENKNSKFEKEAE